jgi:TATA-box binding protein (TBP) (component of TFIID and TFIIIB)
MTDDAVADSLAVQNVVAAAAIDTELDLQPLPENLAARVDELRVAR